MELVQMPSEFSTLERTSIMPSICLQTRLGNPAIGVALIGILLVAIFNSTVLAVAVNARYCQQTACQSMSWVLTIRFAPVFLARTSSCPADSRGSLASCTA